MKYINSLLCSFLSLVLGFTFIKYLTCPPLQMNFYLFITCLIAFAIIFLIYLNAKQRVMLWRTALVCLILVICSYSATLYFFMNPPEAKAIAQISRQKGDPGLGHTAIIVLAHGEPETYDASAWIKQMKEFDEQKIAFIPYPFRPFFFYTLREKYLMAGKSGHNLECMQIMKEIEAEYRNKGDLKTKFYMSYLENEPHPDTAVIEALNEGASNIIICNIFVTISSHTQEAIDMIKAIKLADYGVAIHYSKPLYDSKTLQQLYVDTISDKTKDLDKRTIGVILVGHGQPLEWDKEFYTQTQQETSFRKDILHQLELEGYDAQNLKLAWMEFRDPRPKEAVAQLIKNGTTEIFYFSTIIGSESIHAKFDVPELMYKIKVPNTVKVQQLTAFENQSGIVKALIERIEECK